MWLRLGLSLVLAAGFVAAVSPYLQAIPDDLSVAPWVIPAYVLALVPYHLLRAGRWAVLLRPLGTVSLRDATLVGLAGYMWIAALPFRLGELARPLFLQQRAQIPVGTTLGVVAVERVVDGLSICGLFFLAAGFTTAAPPLMAASVVVGLFAFAVLVLVAMAWRPEAAAALAEATVGRVWARGGAALAGIGRDLGQGVRASGSAGPLAAFTAVTLLYWCTNAAGMWLLAHGCGVPLGPAEAVALLAVMNIALLVPGGPGQLGVFHAGVALGLGLFVDADTLRGPGSVFTFYLYVCQLGTILAAGLAAQWALRLDWRAVLGFRRTAPKGNE